VVAIKLQLLLAVSLVVASSSHPAVGMRLVGRLCVLYSITEAGAVFFVRNTVTEALPVLRNVRLSLGFWIVHIDCKQKNPPPEV